MDTGSREMKYIVAGGRDFANVKYHSIHACAIHKLIARWALDTILSRGDTVVSGKCPTGADLIGESYALWRKLPVEGFPADWNKHGKSAGFIRNQQMAQEADGLIAFWDGKSKGTKHMIEAATRCNLEVHIYRY